MSTLRERIVQALREIKEISECFPVEWDLIPPAPRVSVDIGG